MTRCMESLVDEDSHLQAVVGLEVGTAPQLCIDRVNLGQRPSAHQPPRFPSGLFCSRRSGLVATYAALESHRTTNERGNLVCIPNLRATDLGVQELAFQITSIRSGTHHFVASRLQ